LRGACGGGFNPFAADKIAISIHKVRANISRLYIPRSPVA
jgi:hypothetical protein